MKRTTRSMLSAGVVLVAAAVVVGIVITTEPEEEDDGKPREMQRLVDVGEITAIEVSGANVYELNLTPTGWRMVAPHKVPIEQRMSTRILRALHSSRLEQVFTKDETPDDRETGLDNPEYLVRVVGKKGTVLIEIGDKNPFNGKLHVRVDREAGQVVALTANNIVPAIDQKPIRFLSTAILGAPLDRLEKFRVAPRKGLLDKSGNPVPPFTLERTDVIVEIQGVLAERFFIVSEPDVDGPDIIELQRITSAFAGSLNEFVADTESNRKARGLDNPAFTIEFQLRDPTQKEKLVLMPPVKLLVSSPYEEDPNQVFIAREGFPFLANASVFLYDQLFTTEEMLETKKVILLDISAVHAVEVKLPGESGRVERTRAGGGVAAGWKFSAPSEKKAKANPINKMLVVLSQLEGSERVAQGLSDAQLGGFGLDEKKRRTLRFMARNNALIAELWVGAKTGDSTFVKRADSKYVVKVPSVKLNFVPTKLSDFDP